MAEHESGVVHVAGGGGKLNHFPEEELIVGKTRADNLGVDLLELPETGAVLEEGEGFLGTELRF